MSTNTPALHAEYSRVIPAKFVTHRNHTPMLCMTCAAPLVMGQAFAAKSDDTNWHNYCATCAVSMQSQIAGLVKRVEELVLPLGDNVPEAVTLLVEQATPHIEQVLATGDRNAFLFAKGCLLGIRARIGMERRIDASLIPAGMHTVGEVTVKIDKPETGKWAGWVFVKHGNGDRLGSQRPDGSYKGEGEDLLRALIAGEGTHAEPAQAASNGTVEPGLYVSTNDTEWSGYWLVRMNRAGTRCYASRLVAAPVEGETLRWDYVQGGLGQVARNCRPATEAEVKWLGDESHYCCFCSTALTNTDPGCSVDRGYGPICATRYGLPWG